MSQGWRRVLQIVDWPLFGTTLVIAAIGLVNLYSCTRYVPQRGFFGNQIMWLGIGFAIALALAAVDYRLWLRAGWIILLVGVLSVIGVHFFGAVVKGSRRWLDFGPVRVQPSELMKVALILAIARLVHDRGAEGLRWYGLAYRIFAILLAIVFIAWQPDLGTASIAALIAVSVAFLAARKLWPLLVAGALGLAAIPLLWTNLLPYQQERVRIFLDPSKDPTGLGWHARQSIFAVGSGRVVGKGWLAGTQNQLAFLPEQWTDFPFSVYAEEWGFVGGFVLLALYAFLILWVLNVASQARDRFGATLCLGVAALLFWHVFVNIAMVTGVAPVVGVTLPLVSYGGSSVLTVSIALGLVGSVSVRRFVH